MLSHGAECNMTNILRVSYFAAYFMIFKPFVPNALFPYPLKTLENRKFFWCIQGAEKGYTGNKWIKVKKR